MVKIRFGYVPSMKIRMGNPLVIMFSLLFFLYKKKIKSFHLPLNTFNEEIILFAWYIVGTHDTCFLTSLNNTRKDTTESIETTFVCCRYHFRDVHHQWSSRVTSFNPQESFIVLWTYKNTIDIEIFCSIQIKQMCLPS